MANTNLNNRDFIINELKKELMGPDPRGDMVQIPKGAFNLLISIQMRDIAYRDKIMVKRLLKMDFEHSLLLEDMELGFYIL